MDTVRKQRKQQGGAQSSNGNTQTYELPVSSLHDPNGSDVSSPMSSTSNATRMSPNFGQLLTSPQSDDNTSFIIPPTPLLGAPNGNILQQGMTFNSRTSVSPGGAETSNSDTVARKPSQSGTQLNSTLPLGLTNGCSLTDSKNECYLNTLVQCFRYVKNVQEGLRKCTDNELAKSWVALYDALRTNNAPDVEAKKTEFRTKVAMVLEDKNINKQQDISEVLNLFVNNIFSNHGRDDQSPTVQREPASETPSTETIKQSTPSTYHLYDYLYSKATEYINTSLSNVRNTAKDLYNSLHGQIVYQKACALRPHDISHTVEPFWMLTLPFPEDKGEPLTIKDLLDKYCEVENLTDDVSCVQNTVTSFITIWHMPDVLILTLNRFKNDNTKITTKVSIDKSFQYTPLKDLFSEGITYNLRSVAIHEGVDNNGHYYAYANTTIADTEKDAEWYKFNDSRVTKKDPQEDSQEDSQEVSKNVYMLVYERETR
jgi:ubiquitin C-terminal hydrolase